MAGKTSRFEPLKVMKFVLADSSDELAVIGDSERPILSLGRLTFTHQEHKDTEIHQCVDKKQHRHPNHPLWGIGENTSGRSLATRLSFLGRKERGDENQEDADMQPNEWEYVDGISAGKG
jgi:hypothetical protein